MPQLISKLFLLCFVLLFTISCQKDSIDAAEPAIPQTKSFANVDEALWPYFEQFEEDAAARGLHINLNAQGISGEIMPIDEEHVAGVCNFNARSPNDLVVDQQFWERASGMYREFIVFHELGHCSLLRGHREDVYPSGICKSIMRSGLGDCQDRYTSFTREDFLDELFLKEDNLGSITSSN